MIVFSPVPLFLQFWPLPRSSIHEAATTFFNAIVGVDNALLALTTALCSSWSLPRAPRETHLPSARLSSPSPIVNLVFLGAVFSKVWLKF